MSASRSSSPPRDDLDEILQISKELTQVRKELNRQSRVAKEATEALRQREEALRQKEEACEQLNKALVESKRKEEETSERLIDAEADVSEWKRLATKYKEQSATPKVDSAPVEQLQAKLKHSEERFEEERQKFRVEAAHELRKKQEDFKTANNLFMSRVRIILASTTESLLGEIEAAVDVSISKAFTQGILPGQLSPNIEGRPSTDVLVRSEAGDVPLKLDEMVPTTQTMYHLADLSTAGSQLNQRDLHTPAEFKDATTRDQDLQPEFNNFESSKCDASLGLDPSTPRLRPLSSRSGGKAREMLDMTRGSLKGKDEGEGEREVRKSSASGTREANLTLKDPPSVSPLPIPTKKSTLPSQSSSPLQGPEPQQIPAAPTLPATATQRRNFLEGFRAPSGILRMPGSSAATVPKPIGPLWVKGDNLLEEFGFDFNGPTQTVSPAIKSEKEDSKRRGSPLQSSSKRQKRG